MLKEFRKYDRDSIRKAIIPVRKINEILSDNDIPIKILYKYEDKSNFCKLSIENNSHTTLVSSVVVGNLLGITIEDWYWVNNGYDICIEYQVKKEIKNGKKN